MNRNITNRDATRDATLTDTVKKRKERRSRTAEMVRKKKDMVIKLALFAPTHMERNM